MSNLNVSRQGHRMLQAGVLLFLAALIVGLLVPLFAVPRLGLSAHLLGIMQGLFLLVGGILWPRLKLHGTLSQVGSWLAMYGCAAAWISNVLAGLWGAGSSMVPMAAGGARGSAAQELVISIGLRSAAISLIVATIIFLWGLRSFAEQQTVS